MICFRRAIGRKFTKRLDVMYVHVFAKLSRCFSTMLTSIVISLARLSTLRRPIRPIVGQPSTFPQWVIRAGLIGGHPKTQAFPITKVSFAVESAGDQRELSATLTAIRRHSVVVRAIFAMQILCFPFSHTSRTAKVVFSPSGVTLSSCKRFATLITLHMYAIVVNAIFAGMVFLIALARALKITVVILIAAKLAQFSSKLFSACGACQNLVPGVIWVASANFARQEKAVFACLSSPKELIGRGFMLVALGAMLGWGGVCGNIIHDIRSFQRVSKPGIVQAIARHFVLVCTGVIIAYFRGNYQCRLA